MSEILYTGLLAPGSLGELIAACDFPGTSLFLLESLPTRVVKKRDERLNLLRFAQYDKEIPFAKFTAGRIFTPDAELRWERQEKEEFRVVYCGLDQRQAVLAAHGLEDTFAAQGKHSTETKDSAKTLEARYDAKTKDYYLFGERLRSETLKEMGPGLQEGDYAELRIPRVLRYPLTEEELHEGKRYVIVSIREYRNKESGQIELFRLQGIRTWDRKKSGVQLSMTPGEIAGGL
ncbi:hypothetical protein EPA93_22820 [Ktedonosporobacter rubrisoli]|uniref:Uncharacterized protein n=1 Tax=Ktedonosporobacter rubrisoli TaxID=2509675 RepID=A0A4P6JTA4_KTERU|nr:hypothetical protein [Ktedonosporobacter rubrisoli]QBD78664.1 hypothetical protein EPA93_22820 [Ktedonosporobacter rubrisoli]